MDTICALECAGLLGLVFVVGMGLWFYAHRSGAAIAMDGAACVQMSDGSVVIRKRNLRNLLVLALLGLCLAGIAAMVVSFVRQAAAEVAIREALPVEYVVEMLPGLCTAAGTSGIIVSAMVVLVFALQKPPIRVDAGERAIEVGHGAASRHVPFSDLLQVSVELVRQADAGGRAMVVLGIVVALRDGGLVGLGTVSGSVEQAWARAEGIARRVAGVVGVPVVDGRRQGDPAGD